MSRLVDEMTRPSKTISKAMIRIRMTQSMRRTVSQTLVTTMIKKKKLFKKSNTPLDQLMKNYLRRMKTLTLKHQLRKQKLVRKARIQRRQIVKTLWLEN